MTPEVVEELGSESMVHFAIDALPVTDEAVRAAAESAADEEGKLFADDEREILTARVGGKREVKPCEPVELAIDNTELHFFEPDSGLAIDTGTRAPQLA